MDIDRYLASLREDIVFTEILRDQHLTFHSTWGIFSPRVIDSGTRLLLDYLEIKESDDCFDLGCGYGPLGVTMAKLAPKGKTLMADKDFTAVEYANKNARVNGLTNCEAILSNGFSHVGNRKFDVICSNVPAKVGKEMLHLLLHDAKAHLKPGGCIYVVTITGLRRFIERNFEEVFGNYEKLKQGKDYTVARACKEQLGII